jgi:hypothetical protein
MCVYIYIYIFKKRKAWNVENMTEVNNKSTTDILTLITRQDNLLNEALKKWR